MLIKEAGLKCGIAAANWGSFAYVTPAAGGKVGQWTSSRVGKERKGVRTTWWGKLAGGEIRGGGEKLRLDAVMFGQARNSRRMQDSGA